MKLSFSIAQAIMQSFFAQMILFVFSLYTTMSIPLAFTTTLLLFLFLGMYQTGLGFLFFFIGIGQTTRMILIPLVSSFLVAATLVLYPAFGFTVDFWLLVLVLFIAGVGSFVMLHSAGASWSNNKHG